MAAFNPQLDTHFDPTTNFNNTNKNFNTSTNNFNTSSNFKINNNATQIVWNLRVFTAVDQNVAFVKDNSKETLELEVKKQWEQKQPGRAEKAIIERKKYFIKKKLKDNQQITEEEY